ncbi:MAG: hypothetical protein ABI678_11075 [Kofleriaceae bacterium]
MPIAIWFVVYGAVVVVAILLVRGRTHAARVRRHEAKATADWVPLAIALRPLERRPSRARASSVTVDPTRAREKETTQHMLS